MGEGQTRSGISAFDGSSPTGTGIRFVRIPATETEFRSDGERSGALSRSFDARAAIAARP